LQPPVIFNIEVCSHPHAFLRILSYDKTALSQADAAETGNLLKAD